MLEQFIRGILDLSPRGSSSEQILWRLRNSGLRPDASEIMGALNSLVEQGEAVHRLGRWHKRLLDSRPGDPYSSPSEASSGSETKLLAVHAQIRATVSDNPLEEPAVLDDEPYALPAWDALLGYYAATQRRDPRGRIVEFPDRHQQAWQLFHARGQWWCDAELRFPTSLLPTSFPEALTRRQVDTAAVGWPVSVFQSAEGVQLIPGFILPVSWTLERDELVVNLDVGRPTLNPEWMRAIRARTSWSETLLIERLFPEGEADDLGAISERLRHALSTLGAGVLRPADLAMELNLAGEGLRNAAALFLPDDNTFTRGVADDLEALRGWKPAQRQRTALASLLETEAIEANTSIDPVLATGPLSDSQMAAAETAMNGPVTLIQGPPGTGKSEIILTLIVSALYSGRSVLFAAKNHQAIDEVEMRLADLVPDLPLLVRGRDASGERNTSFLDALRDIATGETRPATEDRTLEALRQAALLVAQKAAEARRQDSERTRLHLALSDLTERASAILGHLGNGPVRRRTSLLRRLLALFGRLLRRSIVDLAAPLPDLAPIAEVEARIADLRQALVTAEPAPVTVIDPEKERVRQLETAELLRRLVPSITRPDEPMRLALAERERELAFDQVKSARHLSPEDARAIVHHRPVWAVSTLSVPARIPLVAGLFDYVIFDEASQCDIASALPLMARARCAVIVGDPQQLAFIPGLGLGAEHALMDAAALPSKGRARLAQSRNSLFDFVQLRPSARRMFLADQFRSAPQIVDYIGGEFYGGRLVWRRDEASFRPPNGYKPGLTWEDVQGRSSREDGGNINAPEAERVVILLSRLANDTSFKGSVGVIAPFNAQVALIQRIAQAKLTETEHDRLALRIATVDKWQGGEADVILFSLVIAPGVQQSARTFIQRERRRINVAISRARAVCIVVGDLTYSRGCGIRHIEHLATRANESWSPPRPPYDSLWERRLDTAMRARGLKPFPQYPVGSRYLDFALDPEGVKLDVEVDGRRWHEGPDGGRKVADRLRDAELMARGWKVARFWVHELEQDMEGCLERIERELGRT